ncbi:MAG: cytochrome P450 [Acidobacteriota bacterium]
MTATVTATFPPGPRDTIFWRELRAFRRNMTGYLLNLARTYGDIVHFKLGPRHAFLLNHPDYIKDVLVTNNKNFVKSRGLERAKIFLGEGLLTSEAEFHMRQRRLSQPAFHRQRIASYADIMAAYGARQRDRWQDGAQLDIAQEMMRVTLAIVGKTLFDADVESEAQDVQVAIADILEHFNLLILPFSELLDKLPFSLPSAKRFQKACARLDEIVYRIINERRSNRTDRGDLLSMLLLAQDEEGDGSSMTDIQLRDEVMTIFLAGHETTANALTWTWYLISQHPEVEAKLSQELDTVLAGRLPNTDDLARLRYTDMVLAESMRLYPPAWGLGRRALNDYPVGGYIIPANSIVFVSQYVMHHDPRYYPDPHVFNPERWHPEAQAARPKFSYFPFGGGPRQCIGDSFAWMEGVLLIATYAQKWRMRLVPGHPVATQPLVTLRPKHGMLMTVHHK